MLENSENLMTLGVLHLYEEPATYADCMELPSDIVVVLDHNLNLTDELHVPSSWTCVTTTGRYTSLVDDHETTFDCDGYIARLDIPTCGYIEAAMTVACEDQPYEGD